MRRAMIAYLLKGYSIMKQWNCKTNLSNVYGNGKKKQVPHGIGKYCKKLTPRTNIMKNIRWSICFPLKLFGFSDYKFPLIKEFWSLLPQFIPQCWWHGYSIIFLCGIFLFIWHVIILEIPAYSTTSASFLGAQSWKGFLNHVQSE